MISGQNFLNHIENQNKQDSTNISKKQELLTDLYKQYKNQYNNIPDGKWNMRKKQTIQQQLKLIQEELDACKQKSEEYNPIQKDQSMIYTQEYCKYYELYQIGRNKKAIQDSTQKYNLFQPISNECKYAIESVKNLTHDIESMNDENKIPMVQIHEEYCTNPSCNKKIMVQKPEQAVWVCTQCGYSKTYIDSTLINMSYGEECEYNSYTYKRTSYFLDDLMHFQGKERIRVTTEELREITQYLIEVKKFKSADDITIMHIHDAVHDLKKSALYKSINQIYHIITNKPIPTLTPEQETLMKKLFNDIQDQWNECRPLNRKNFLPYLYCIHKFLQLMQLNDYLEFAPLMKDQSKLECIEESWQKICNKLGWIFHPSLGDKNKRIKTK